MTSQKETQDQLLGLVSDFMKEGDRTELATVQLVQDALHTLLGGTVTKIDETRTHQGQTLATEGADESLIIRHHVEAMTRRNLAFPVDGLVQRFVSLNPVEAIEKPGEKPLASVPEPQETSIAEVA